MFFFAGGRGGLEDFIVEMGGKSERQEKSSLLMTKRAARLSLKNLCKQVWPVLCDRFCTNCGSLFGEAADWIFMNL